jgi:hypothetical protein
VRNEDKSLVSLHSVQTVHCEGCFLAMMEESMLQKESGAGDGAQG